MAASSSLLEYTESEIFVSGISPTKRQITFMATLLLYNSGTIFRTRPVLNQSVDPELRSRYAPPKTVRFSYRKCSGKILSNCPCSVLRHTQWLWRYLHQTKFNLWKIITTVPVVVKTWSSAHFLRCQILSMSIILFIFYWHP